jgi:cyclophilin family peptidyl-prolyl cis-trans isomerase
LFICTGTSAALDGQYTAFGRVVDGVAVVEAIESSPRNGETPTTRVELRAVGSKRSRGSQARRPQQRIRLNGKKNGRDV